MIEWLPAETLVNILDYCGVRKDLSIAVRLMGVSTRFQAVLRSPEVDAYIRWCRGSLTVAWRKCGGLCGHKDAYTWRWEGVSPTQEFRMLQESRILPNSGSHALGQLLLRTGGSFREMRGELMFRVDAARAHDLGMQIRISAHVRFKLMSIYALPGCSLLDAGCWALKTETYEELAPYAGDLEGFCYLNIEAPTNEKVLNQVMQGFPVERVDFHPYSDDICSAILQVTKTPVLQVVAWLIHGAAIVAVLHTHALRSFPEMPQ